MKQKALSRYERMLLLQYPVRTLLGMLLTFLAITCFAYGVFSPFLEVDKFWLFDNTVSLYSSIVQLFQTQNYFLFLIVFIFSIIIPIIKFSLLAYVIFLAKPPHARYVLNWIEKISKWAMLDVFVIAIMVVTVKLGAVVSFTIHIGVIYFAVSIISSTLLVKYFNLLLAMAEQKRHAAALGCDTCG